MSNLNLILFILMKVIYYLAILIIYLFSVWGAFNFYRKAFYHSKGKYKINDILVSRFDQYVIVIPIFNTIVSIQYIVGYWKHKSERKNFFWLKWFHDDLCHKDNIFKTNKYET